MTELAFVLAPRQNLFFVELVEALRDELDALGVPASIHEGRFPPPRADRVYVLAPPHEYFRLTHGEPGVPAEALARTVFVCAEQPGTRWFEENRAVASRGGAVFDINRHGANELARRGVPAEHLQIGASARWQRPDDGKRDIDVLFMGAASDRRLAALGEYVSSLWRLRCRFVLSDGRRPNWAPAANFVAGEDKLDLLARTKVLVNVHQEELPYFEWLRAVQAVGCGAALVSEHSLDFDPLAAGRDFVAAPVESLGLLAARLADDDERRAAMVASARRTLSERAPLSAAARALADRAASLATRPVAYARDPHFLPPAEPPAPSPVFAQDDVVPGVTEDPGVSLLRRGLKDARLEILDLRRRVARLVRAMEQGSRAGGLEVAASSQGWAGGRPRVSVLISVHDYGHYVGAALDSLVTSSFRDWEAIVVDDGSSDDSAHRVAAWLERHPRRRGLLVRHLDNRGLPHARNSALAFARGELVFVLDADNELLPPGLERLVAAMDADPHTAFTYGMHQRFDAHGPLGLANVWPWEPGRLRTENFVDAMALMRADVLRRAGGYDADPRLHGWEDFDLWCRLAEHGHRGVAVAEPVARYRCTGHSMLSLTNLSGTDAFSLLIERYPRLMAGLRPPL